MKTSLRQVLKCIVVKFVEFVFQVSRSALEHAPRMLNEQFNGTLVPAGVSSKDWAREEAHTIKQMLVLLRVTEYRSKDFSRPCHCINVVFVSCQTCE